LLYQLGQEVNLSQQQIAVLPGCDQSKTRARINTKSCLESIGEQAAGTELRVES